jgi:hypothetical protein
LRLYENPFFKPKYIRHAKKKNETSVETRHALSNQRQANTQNLKLTTLSKCEINAPLYLFVFLKKKLSNMEKTNLFFLLFLCVKPQNTEGPLRQILRDMSAEERLKLPLRFS